MKAKLLSFLFLIAIATTAAFAQCNCDFTLKGQHPVRNEFDASDLPGYQPGDVICLEAGIWASTSFTGIKGAPGNPLIIKNCGGAARFAGQYVGIYFDGCQYIKLTGTGDTSITYGIVIDSTTTAANGIAISNLSSDFEVEYCEIQHTRIGGSGISAKTDPRCNNVNTWRQNFTLKNLSIHNNYIHDTGDEGMYIGYTGGYITSKIKCGADTAFGHFLENVEIYDNVIERTGRDGMQVSLSHKNMVIRNNYINTYGNNGLFDQNFGLLIGGGSSGKVYNNTVIQSPTVNPNTWNDVNSRGISVISAIPSLTIYNNVVVSPAGDGIWLHQRVPIKDKTVGYYVINNTIINPGQSGILYNSNVPGTPNEQEDLDNGFYNNVIVNPARDYSGGGFWKTVDEEYVDFNTKNQRNNASVSNNYTTDDIATLLFTDPTSPAWNFHIDSLSPARNYGMNVSQFGVSKDFDNRPRSTPEDTVYDAGAFEYTKAAPVPIGINQSNSQGDFKVFPNPTNGKVNITMELNSGGQAMIRIVDFRGALIAEQNYSGLSSGSNNIVVDLKEVNFKGPALLMVFTKDKTRTSTIVIE